MFRGGLGSDHIVQRPANYIAGTGNFSRGDAGSIYVCCYNYNCPCGEAAVVQGSSMKTDCKEKNRKIIYYRYSMLIEL